MSHTSQVDLFLVIIGKDINIVMSYFNSLSSRIRTGHLS